MLLCVYISFYIMCPLHPRLTRTDTCVPDTALFRSLGTETSLCQGGTEHQAVVFRRMDAALVIVDRRVMLGAPVVPEDDIAGPPSMAIGKGRLAEIGRAHV